MLSPLVGRACPDGVAVPGMKSESCQTRVSGVTLLGANGLKKKTLSGVRYLLALNLRAVLAFPNRS